MRSISRQLIDLVVIFFVLFSCKSYSAQCSLNADSSTPFVKGREQLSSACIIDPVGGYKEIQLVFDLRRSVLYLKSGRERVVLENIGGDFDPSLIGVESRLRFLPPALQPYRSQGLLLFVSSRRSVAGTGGGQCGAGAEDFLNILDANKKPAKVLARLLIGSCLDNVELIDSSEFGAYKSFWVDGGVLAMQFLSYDDRCEERLMAKLDVASKRLRFFPSR